MKKFLLISVSLLIFFFLVLFLASGYFMSPERISDMANNMLDEKLEVEIQSASLNPLSRSVVFGGVTLSAVEQEKRIILFSAEELSAGTVSIIAALKGNLVIGSLSADHFFLDLTALPDHSTSSNAGRTSASVNIGSFDLQRGEMIFSKATVTGINVTAGPLIYNPDPEEEPDIFSLFQDIDASIDRIEYRLNEDRYLLQIQSLAFSERESSINADRIKLETVLSDTDFFNSLDKRSELFYLDISGISTNRTSFASFRKNGDLISGAVSIDSLHLHATLNKQIPAEEDPDTVLMPLQILNDLPVTITLDSLTVNHGDILYSEYAEEGVRPGTIMFAGTRATILNIDNRSDDPVVLKARSYLENTGVLETEIRLFTDETGQVITVRGELGEFDLTRLNNIFMDLEGLEITGGMIYDLKFDYRMAEKSSTGSVQIHYDGFSMNKISIDDYQQNLGDRISGIVMNQFVMRASSRTNDSEFRDGTVSAERNPEKGFFNYLWISLRSGILDVVSRI